MTNELINRKAAIDALEKDKALLDNIIKGFEDGKVVHEKSCEGCKYEYENKRKVPCILCPNNLKMPCTICTDKLKNQWTAKEQKDDTAEWLMGGVSYICDTSVYCSKCKWAWGKKEELGFFDFCPNCGRKIIHRGEWRRVGDNN